MPRHTPVPLSEVDLADIDGFADERGYAQFDTLRAEDPVHWNPEPDGPGFWNVVRYEDIWTVDRDPETFTSTKFVNLEDVDDDLRDARRSLLEKCLEPWNPRDLEDLDRLLTRFAAGVEALTQSMEKHD